MWKLLRFLEYLTVSVLYKAVNNTLDSTQCSCDYSYQPVYRIKIVGDLLVNVKDNIIPSLWNFEIKYHITTSLPFCVLLDIN